MSDVITIGDATLYQGDYREVLPSLPTGSADMVLADPNYGDTSLSWDRHTSDWMPHISEALKLTGSLWLFGSLRSLLLYDFTGWTYAQDVVWEKHNGSNFIADRFKRVHELVVQFYRGKWQNVYKCPQHSNDATKRTVRRKRRPPHTGNIEAASFASTDGGPRLLRSVLPFPSCHGEAQHPTQKPVPLTERLVDYSCPLGGTCLDFGMGSGTTGVACANLGRRFIGIEIERKYFDIACERIEAAYAQGRLFG